MLALTAVLSLACYYAVERPIRYAKRSLPWILGTTAAALAISGVIYKSSGLYDTSHLPVVTYRVYQYDLRPNATGSDANQGALATMDIPMRTVPADTYLTGGIVVGDPHQAPDVVLTGNSHGVMWSHAVRNACQELGINARLWSMEGVDPAFSDPPKRGYPGLYITQEVKYRYDKARYDMIAKWKPKLVLVSARWEHYGTMDHIRQAIEYMAKHADQVILIGQPPTVDFGQRYAVQVLASKGISNQGNPDIYMDAMPESWAHGNKLIHDLADEYDNVSVLDTADLYTDPTGKKTLVMTGGEILYYDDDHLSDAGAQRAKSRFAQVLGPLVQNQQPTE